MVDLENSIAPTGPLDRPAVVLDKSFLRAASNRQLLGLFARFEVVVPQSLIFEILTASSTEDRVFCAERLRFSGQEFRIVETTGTLLRFEIEHQKPCSPVLELVRSPKAELGARMAESPLTLRPGEDAGIRIWREDLGESVEAFLAESETIPRIFTDLANAKESTRKATATTMRAQVAADSSHVLKLYSSMTNPTYPPVDGLNEDWAFFRRLQVRPMKLPIEFDCLDLPIGNDRGTNSLCGRRILALNGATNSTPTENDKQSNDDRDDQKFHSV